MEASPQAPSPPPGLTDFRAALAQTNGDEELLRSFVKERILSGVPFVFAGRDSDYESFRARIATEFKISADDVVITGSGKLGFSPIKGTAFSYDSDIDVALVSEELYDQFMWSIHGYQMALREQRKAVSARELEMYHQFLEYTAIGWMRPDLLPFSFRIDALKNDWFSFFSSISNAKSEVGNYKVSAGVFKTAKHLELYTASGLKSLYTKLKIGALNDLADQT